MGKAKHRTPWWLLYLATAALYAALYVDWPGSAPFSDWIGWTVGALGLLLPPFLLGFGYGVDWSRKHPAEPER